MKLKINGRKIFFASVLALLYTLMQCIGYSISSEYGTSVHLYENLAYLDFLLEQNPFLWGVIEFFLLVLLLHFLFCSLEKQQNRIICYSINTTGYWIEWIIIAIALIVCWLPCYWAGYPGYYNYDAPQQVPQAMYEEVPYSAHHPLIHTLLMGKIIKFGYEHGNTLNDGIVLHSWFQIIVCAVFFSFFCIYIVNISKRLWVGVFTFLWYALMPTIALFTMSTTKDTIFSLLLQAEVLLIYQFIREKNNRKHTWIMLIAVGVLMCLFRKNGSYALLLVIPLSLCITKEIRKKIVLAISVILGCYVLIDTIFCVALKAEPGSPEEMLSVPMQQIARVYVDKGESAFSADELDLIYQGISGKSLLAYNPFLSDNIKNNFDYNVIENQKMDYLMLWLKKGMQYPNEYVRAFLDNTYQAWYPGTSIYDGQEIYYFDMDMVGGAERETKNQKLLDFYTRIAEGFYYQKTPVLRLFFSIGAMFWVALFTTAYAIFRKDRALIIAMTLVLGTCLTVFLGPISLVRYYLILFYGFPVHIAFLLVPKNEKE